MATLRSVNLSHLLILILALASANPGWLRANAQSVNAATAAFLVSRAKALRAQANQAKADLDKAQALLDTRLADEQAAAKVAADADAAANAATATLNAKKAVLDQAKQQQEAARQATIQAKLAANDEASYLDDLEGQAEEAAFDEAQAAQDIIDAQNRLATTNAIWDEQKIISTEALAEASSAARSAARLGTADAKAYQLTAYNIKLQADRILVAVQKQAANAQYRLDSRTTEHGNKIKDKSDTRGAADEQKAIKVKADKDASDSLAFYNAKINAVKVADAEVKVANNVAAQKLAQQRTAKAVLTSKSTIRANQEKSVGALSSRFNAFKGTADTAEIDCGKKGLKLD